LPAIYYNKLHRAVDWHRWDEVLDLVAKLDANRKINFIKVPEVELARNRAKALAGLGRVEEGLAEYKKCEGQTGCPSWLHKAFVAGIYDTAKQYDKAIEYTLLSMQDKENPSMYPDLAYRFARFKRDAINARKALNEAEKAVLPEYGKPFLLRSRGWVGRLLRNPSLTWSAPAINRSGTAASASRRRTWRASSPNWVNLIWQRRVFWKRRSI
jgi:tetratricopeptide (TPR) repeat protein